MIGLHARSLRKTMTRQEVRLWVHLRTWRSKGFHFRRQVPRGDYIVDFACLRQRLIVEVDGGQHAMPPGEARDRRRDNWLKAQGFTILRFWNHDIDRNIEGVLQTIESALLDAPTPALRADPPPLGEG